MTARRIPLSNLTRVLAPRIPPQPTGDISTGISIGGTILLLRPNKIMQFVLHIW